MSKKKLTYIINADWYFRLHWFDRAIAATTHYEVSVICPSNDPAFISECKENGITHFDFKISRTGKNIFYEIKKLYELNKLLNLIMPDIIHSVTIKPNLYLSILKPRNVSVVMTFAGLGTLRTSSGLTGHMILALLKILMSSWNNREKVISLFENSDDLNYLTQGLSFKKTRCYRVFGAGVNMEHFSPTPLDKTTLPKILFASRMLKDKGLKELVDAIRIVNSEKKIYELYVAGIIDSESPLSYTELEIQIMAANEDFIWLGKRDDISKLISQSIAVCLPTRYGEGVPRILIEALACARPIITTSYGGCKDICLNNITGFQIDPNNIEEIAERIKKLISEPNLAIELGLNGRNLVEKKFSNEIIINQNLNFYELVSI
ncbi:glycosyltransferase family 4 protein [Providencia rettgeri]